MFFDPRLFGLTRGVRLRLLATAAFGLLAVLVGLGRLAASGYAIARVFQGADIGELAPLLMGVAALVVLRSVLQYLRDILAHHTAAIVKINLRHRLYRHALALGPGHFDQKRTGDVLLSFVDGVEQLETYFGQYLPQLIVALVTPPLVFVFMATLDLQVASVFLSFAIVTLIVPAFLRTMNAQSSEARRLAYGAYGSEFLDSIQGLATLKAFGQAKVRGAALAEKARTLYKSTMWVLGVNIGTGGLSMLGVSAGAATALGLGAVRVSQGELPLASLLVILLLGIEVFRPIRELVQLFHQGILAQSSAQGIFALLDTPVRIQGPERPQSPGAAPRPEIAFEHVSFGYLGGERPALHDVSFTLRAGETLGVVGPSGAGKSTLVWLLLRFVDPVAGRITLGDRDLRDIPLEVLRGQIAVVTQDTYLFNGTIAENLRFGRSDASPDELASAARAANALEFIQSLPDGFETMVGERGARLSGGQRQRIAIARAILKNAPILILDEALSSVDAENEAAIQEALDRLMVGRTTLVIAHRLSSVIGADRCLVLESGCIAEVGTHRELVAADGLYARLMAPQQADEPSGDDMLVPRAIAAPQPAAVSPQPRAASAPLRQGETARAAPEVAIGAVWSRLFKIVQPWWPYLGLTFVTGLAHHAAVIGLGATSALLVGAVATGQDIQGWLWALSAMVVISAVLTWAETWFAHDLAYMLLAEMRVDAYDTLEPLAPAYLVKRRSGDLVSIAGGDVETIELFFAHTITPAFVAVLVPASVLIALGAFSWILALVLLPFLLAVAASPFFAQRSAERLGAGVRHEIGYIHAHMVDSIQGLKEIVAFGQADARAGAIDDNGWRLAALRGRLTAHQSLQSGFIEAMTGLAGLSVLGTGAVLVTQGVLPRSSLPLVTVLSFAAFGPVAELAKTAKQLVETLASARRLFAVQDEPVPVRDGPGAPSTPSHAAPPGVELRGVRFRYDHGEPLALDELNLTLESGRTTALVGSSGAGKTTTAHMLLRYWDPEAGAVLLDGQDLRDFKLDDLRGRIALVSQDTYLFNTTLRENLRLGRPGATDAEIEAAARQANAHDFISALPDGYDTSVGERGVQLSGGQRQRIAIARAILKDAPLLILDEATSHLDAVNEREVRAAFATLMEGRTTLVIAHRLSTIRDADKIVVLDRGHVAEQGTHAELIRGGGLYASLVARQIVQSEEASGSLTEPDRIPLLSHGHTH